MEKLTFKESDKIDILGWGKVFKLVYQRYAKISCATHGHSKS
jgi:hypothetical protein